MRLALTHLPRCAPPEQQRVHVGGFSPLTDVPTTADVSAARIAPTLPPCLFTPCAFSANERRLLVTMVTGHFGHFGCQRLSDFPSSDFVCVRQRHLKPLHIHSRRHPHRIEGSCRLWLLVADFGWWLLHRSKNLMFIFLVLRS